MRSKKGRRPIDPFNGFEITFVANGRSTYPDIAHCLPTVVASKYVMHSVSLPEDTPFHIVIRQGGRQDWDRDIKMVVQVNGQTVQDVFFNRGAYQPKTVEGYYVKHRGADIIRRFELGQVEYVYDRRQATIEDAMLDQIGTISLLFYRGDISKPKRYKVAREPVEHEGAIKVLYDAFSEQPSSRRTCIIPGEAEDCPTAERYITQKFQPIEHDMQDYWMRLDYKLDEGPSGRPEQYVKKEEQVADLEPLRRQYNQLKDELRNVQQELADVRENADNIAGSLAGSGIRVTDFKRKHVTVGDNGRGGYASGRFERMVRAKREPSD